jgi:hypothetical protein
MHEVSEDARRRTTKCSSDFFCLKSNGNPKCSEEMPLCSVDYYIDKTDLVVKFTSNTDCPYKSSFGQRYICTCPVRHEIFERYHI